MNTGPNPPIRPNESPIATSEQYSARADDEFARDMEEIIEGRSLESFDPWTGAWTTAER